MAQGLIDRIAAAQLVAPIEPVDAVQEALMADVGPMSFTGMAMFILDALAAAGFEVKKSAGAHLADRPGGASGVGTADAPPAAPLGSDDETPRVVDLMAALEASLAAVKAKGQVAGA